MRVRRSWPWRAEDVTVHGRSVVRVETFVGLGVQDSVFEHPGSSDSHAVLGAGDSVAGVQLVPRKALPAWRLARPEWMAIFP